MHDIKVDQTSWKEITVKFLQLGYLAPKSRLRLWNNKAGFERCWARSGSAFKSFKHSQNLAIHFDA